jgi:hypothetical protein
LVSDAHADELLMPDSLMFADAPNHSQDASGQFLMAASESAIDPAGKEEKSWQFGPSDFNYLRGYLGLRAGIASPAEEQIMSRLRLRGSVLGP